MAWALLLLMLITYCSGASSQPVLTQPSSQSASPGQTVKLSCTISSDTNTIHWYQQRAGQAPRFVLYGTSTGSGDLNRFTGSTSDNIAYLTITNLQDKDDADYYCAMWYSSGSRFIFGGGTQLTVLGQPKASPTVYLYPPSSEEIEAKSKATLVCLMSGFYPGSVQVTWKAGTRVISSGVETTKPSKQTDNKFVASSYLSLSATDWNGQDETYICQVTHDEKTFEKTVKRTECS